MGIAPLALATILFAGCGSSKPAACVGAERCDCYPNHTCDNGLTCMSNICVSTTPGGSGGVMGGNDGPAAGSSGAADTSVLTSTGGQGGTTIPTPGGTGGGTTPPGGTGGVTTPPGGTGGVTSPPGGTGGTGTGGVAGPNLVKNGDFSQGKLYWDLTLHAGDVGAQSYSDGQYCVYNESSAAYLSFSLGYPSSPSDAFAVDVGSTYTFSYQVTGWGSIQAKVGGAVTPYTPVSSYNDSAASSVTTQTFTHVITPTTSVAQTGLVFNGTLNYLDSVCFDNVSFVKN